MIVVDANLLVYSSFADLPQHERAREWLDDRLSGTDRVGLPWPSLLSFARLASNPRVFERPMPLSEAWARVRDWLDQPPCWVPSPTPEHARIVDELLSGESASRLVPDAHLAALAIEHGLTVCSTDGDFARFDRVRWENPVG